MIERKHLGMFGHVSHLQTEVSTSSALSACFAASNNILPEPDWHYPCGISTSAVWLYQVCTSKLWLTTCWTLPLIRLHGKWSQQPLCNAYDFMMNIVCETGNYCW